MWTELRKTITLPLKVTFENDSVKSLNLELYSILGYTILFQRFLCWGRGAVCPREKYFERNL